MSSIALQQAERRALLWCTSATMVMFWPSGLDASQLPKLAIFVVAVGLVTALRLASSPLRAVWPRDVPTATLGALVLLMVVSTFRSPVLWTSLFGQYQRYSGFILYGAGALAFLGARRVFRQVAPITLVYVLAGVGAIQAIVSAVQLAGIEVVPRGTDYGGAFGTMGNPNFLSAVFGITLPAFTWIAATGRPLGWRLAGGVGGVSVAVLAWVGGSVQGPIAGAAGLGVLLAAWLLKSGRKRLAAGLCAAAVVGAMLLALGLAEIGPGRVVTARGGLETRRWYWAAAVDMVRAEPFAGVGLDMYGSRYRQFRLQAAIEALGVETVADEPHSVPLNMFASGGLPLGVAYLLFISSCAVCLIKRLRRGEGDPLLAGAVGGAWLAYHVQSTVSIDAPGLVVAHFVLAGALVTPWEPQGGRRKPARGRSVPMWQVGAATLVLLGAAWGGLRVARADSAAGTARAAMERGDRPAAAAALNRAVRLMPSEPTYAIERGRFLIATGEFRDAYLSYRDALRDDPYSLPAAVTAARLAARLERNDDVLTLYRHVMRIDPTAPALIVEAANAVTQAGHANVGLSLAERAVALIPEDADSWLALGRVQRALGRVLEARASFLKALELAPHYDKPAAELRAVS